MNAKIERGEDRMAGDRLDLDAIEARLKAATPGPWVVREKPWPISALGDERFPDGLTLSAQRQVTTAWEHGQVKSPLSIWYLCSSPYGEPDEILTIDEHDADFIAHAPEDIAALLAEVQALRARAVPDPREAAPQSVVDIFRILNADRDRYKAERDALRAAIEKFTAPMDETTSVEYGPGWYELRAVARDGGAPHPAPTAALTLALKNCHTLARRMIHRGKEGAGMEWGAVVRFCEGVGINETSLLRSEDNAQWVT